MIVQEEDDAQSTLQERFNGMTERFDLIVLGTGTAGSAVATRCRAAGWTVAVIDDQPYGGTCALRGCDPKKVLVGVAEAVALNRRMAGHGVDGSTSIDWPGLERFKRSFTDPVPPAREKAFEDVGIVTVHGKARFVAEDRLTVGDREIHAEHVLIATGASPRALGIPGENSVISSTEFLEMDRLPRRIAFIGGGYVSFEFAHIAHIAGADVVVLARGKPLKTFECSLVDRLVAESRAKGIDVRTETEVIRVEHTPSSTTIWVRTPRGESTIETDLVVHGAGRAPNTDHLDAKTGNVQLDSRGAVEVNEFLQSKSNARVYAAGDVALPPGSLPLTPVAAHQGVVVASNLIRGNNKRPDYRGISSIVFTDPPLARVGLTEQAANEARINVRVETGDTRNWLSNRRVLQPAAMYKTIIDDDSDRLVGAHLLGINADEVINLFAMAVRFEIPTTDLKHMIFGYPTSGSDIPYML